MQILRALFEAHQTIDALRARIAQLEADPPIDHEETAHATD